MTSLAVLVQSSQYLELHMVAHPLHGGSTLSSNFNTCTVATIPCNKYGLVTASNLPLQEDKSFDVKLVKYQREPLQQPCPHASRGSSSIYG